MENLWVMGRRSSGSLRRTGRETTRSLHRRCRGSGRRRRHRSGVLLLALARPRTQRLHALGVVAVLLKVERGSCIRTQIGVLLDSDGERIETQAGKTRMYF